ncbi:hypothetical protein [Streptomyces sp. NBC_00239]|uniref:hypothetical protein n=1 Tax=Streptomyces sp. NBC_00239 TaxID=2903640 RepID=UPI002E2A641A|nr:hypothetical protein [Streptomyces sp. NBC_00239]
MKSSFPYPTLFGDIDLKVHSVSVDQSELPYTMISPPDRTVALHQSGRQAWECATLRLEATLPREELGSGAWTDVVCLAVLSEKATNARTVGRLHLAEDGTARGTVELARMRHRSRATLTLLVVATVEGVAGRVIGSAVQDWYIDLKASAPVRQREIEIVEVDFREGPHAWLRPYRDSAWIVETVGDIPTVYLNTGAVEGLTELLSGAGSPAEKIVRDLTAGQIAQDAWTAMFHTAVSDLDEDEDGTPHMPTGWREAVLRMMLPDVVPGRGLAEALHEITRRRTQGYGWAEIQTGVQFAASRRSRTSRNLTSALRSLDRAERTTPR